MCVFQGVAVACGAPVLPDDGARDGFAAFSVPDHGGFALVGDADGGDFVFVGADFRQRFVHDGELRAPDGFGVVLDPAGLREVLGEVFLRDVDDVACAVKDDGA